MGVAMTASDGDPDTVQVCPGCDSARIYRLRRSISGGHATHDFKFTCRACGANFDDPAERERKGSGNIRSGTLAAALADPDVTEVADL